MDKKKTDLIRLQVFLSHNGICSRRKAFDLVVDGSVSVNGKKVREPSHMVDGRVDKIEVDGRPVKSKEYEYVLLNKPAGVVTTKQDRHAKKTVFDLLPKEYRHLSPVGRLDKDTEGLLLLTNDGDLAYRLTHPKFNVRKIYFVEVKGLLSPENKKKLEKGIIIEDKKTSPAKIRNLIRSKEKTEFLMTIHEGRKRQIRLMLGKVGHKVSYLKRIKQGSLSLGNLKIGDWKVLYPREIRN